MKASPRRVKSYDGLPFTTKEEAAELIAPFAPKFLWFAERGYNPHIWQMVFHASHSDDRIRRYRCLVAGRRGGKTLSAAWEVIYYAANPREFHHDVHGTDSDRPLHIWVLTPDYRSSGRAALQNIRLVLKESGLVEGVDYKENRGDLYIQFENGSLIEFKTAERPDKLVGAGIDILWIDEAALIPSQEAYDIARPALSDKIGIVICTTTPRGKNWFYKHFWGETSQTEEYGSVEYRSIDNPYFTAKEWQSLKRDYHPLMFKQEFMASFDSMAGKDLSGEWLRYFTFEKSSSDPDVAVIPRKEEDPSKYDLETFIGVDPAVSLSDEADRFAIAMIGVTPDKSQAFLLRIWAGRIPFHEQLEKIDEWQRLYKPQYIGVESVAYQRVLAEQAMRLPSMPNVLAIFAPGKKFERIMAMSPIFRVGKMRINEKMHRDFIEEWVDYDSSLKNTNDDCLDAVEIALRVAGVMLPGAPGEELFSERPQTLEEVARYRRNSLRGEAFDPDMGSEY